MRSVKVFSIRKGDLELRSCTKELLQTGERTTAEIVLWESDSDLALYCTCMAFWRQRQDGGFELCFVADRPFSSQVECSDFWALAKAGQDILSRVEEVEESQTAPRIVVEGPPQSGKTLLAWAVRDALARLGIEADVVEPHPMGGCLTRPEGYKREVEALAGRYRTPVKVMSVEVPPEG